MANNLTPVDRLSSSGLPDVLHRVDRYSLNQRRDFSTVLVRPQMPSHCAKMVAIQSGRVFVRTAWKPHYEFIG